MKSAKNNNQFNKSKAMKTMDKTEQEIAKKEYENIRDGSRKEVSIVCQKYLKALVDTRAAPKVGVPSLIGGYPGRTGIVRYVEQFEASIGMLGMGYIALNYAATRSAGRLGGPFNNTNNIEYTDGSFNSNSLPQAGIILPGGVNHLPWSQSKFDTTALGLQPASSLQYRLVGATVTIFPTSSVLTQNGRIVLVEPPGHVALNAGGAINAGPVESLPTAHVIRGVQPSNGNNKVVLNWHPRDTSTFNGFESDDFSFKDTGDAGLTPTPTVIFGNDGVILLLGAVATNFHVEVCGMYELRGKLVSDLAPRLTDSRGMDLVMNTLSHKLISGYVGKPERVYEGYLHRAWKSAKELAGSAYRNRGAISGALESLAGFTA